MAQSKRLFKALSAVLPAGAFGASVLLALVSTLAGRENILRAYRHAVAAEYRFYSYGDCMLIR